MRIMTDIHRACATDPWKKDRRHVELYDGHLYATDGVILARVRAEDVEQDGDTPGLVPVEAVRAARKRVRKRRGSMKGVEARVYAREVVTSPMGDGFLTMSRPDREKGSPDYEKILKPNGSTMVAKVNPRLLVRLLQALGYDKDRGDQVVKITIIERGDGEPKPIILDFGDEGESRGAIMPLR